MRDALRALCAAALILTANGCDPCSGVSGCLDAPRLRVGGRVLDTGTGLPIGGVVIRIVASTDDFADSTTTTTAANGTFLANIDVPQPGLYAFDLAVLPPGLPGYRLNAQRCEVRTIRGDGCELGPLGSKPYFPYVLDIFYRGPDTVLAVQTSARFTRTGGTNLYGDSIFADVYTDHADESGRIAMLGLYVFAETPEPLTGDLTVFFDGRPDSSVFQNITLRPTTRFREGPIRMEMRAGPSLAYTFAFTDAATANPIPGVKVTFTRAAGVETAAPTASGVSDDMGRARIDMRPLGAGDVSGVVAIEPPAPRQGFSEAITLTTHDDDLAPVIRTYGLTTSPASRLGRGKD